MPSYKLAIDTGGTYTDFCLIDDSGSLLVYKEPSTPEDPAKAVLTGIKSIIGKYSIDPGQIDFVLLGTTVGANAILEHNGAPITLLTTKGFKDILYIGRQNRPHLYDFRAVKPPPLLPRQMILEVNERILADGTIHISLTEEEIQNTIRQVKEAGVTAVAICLLHAYTNPVHEQMLKEALKKHLPSITISISSEILPEFREYERTSTTVIDAYIKPLVEKHLNGLEKELSVIGIKSELFIMQSGGGVLTAAEARQQCAQITLSGPAGSVLAGVKIATATPHRNLLTADMGGTSMDISLINQGKALFTTEGNICGYPMRLPMLDIVNIGAGGGSIAWIDAGGVLQVGPRSAGANPGPACYDLGGEEPTATDANVVLGRLAPGDLAGRHIEINPDLAALAISVKICAPLGISLEEAAEGIIRIVNAKMVRAMRLVSVEKGYDPRLFTLAPLGGACPLHAVELAGELDIPRVLIAPHPGVASAWGMLSADVRHYYSATCLLDFVPEACGHINELYERLTLQGKEILDREGFAEKDRQFLRIMDIRYKGQSYELTLIVPANSLLPADLQIITRRFHREHNNRYGYDRQDAQLESVAVRLIAIGALPKEDVSAQTGAGNKKLKPVYKRDVYYSGAYRQTPVYRRLDLGTDTVIMGPAVITQEDTTTLLWPGNRLTCDRWGNMIILREGTNI